MEENDFFINMKDQIELLNRVASWQIEIGVIEGQSKERSPSDNTSYPITNAYLLRIHENGSPIRGIPPRPVLYYTIQWFYQEQASKVMSKIIKGVMKQNWKEKEIEDYLKKVCLRIERHAREMIYDVPNPFKDNAPSTAKRKWKKEPGHKKGDKWQWPEGNHPLFDTGDLARSLVCRLKKV